MVAERASFAERAAAQGMTVAEMRMELQLDGMRSIQSAGFLALAQSNARIEKLLERIVELMEHDRRKGGK